LMRCTPFSRTLVYRRRADPRQLMAGISCTAARNPYAIRRAPCLRSLLASSATAPCVRLTRKSSQPWHSREIRHRENTGRGDGGTAPGPRWPRSLGPPPIPATTRRTRRGDLAPKSEVRRNRTGRPQWLSSARSLVGAAKCSHHSPSSKATAEHVCVSVALRF